MSNAATFTATEAAEMIASDYDLLPSYVTAILTEWADAGQLDLDVEFDQADIDDLGELVIAAAEAEGATL